MRRFRRSSNGQILLMTAIIVCILLFVVGGFLAEASKKRPPRESEDIYFVFENIKAETVKVAKYALNDNNNTGYLSSWESRVDVYIDELGYDGYLTCTWNTPGEWSVDCTLIIQSTDTILQDRFTVYG